VSSAANPTIATADLKVGMFIHLDLGWMSHPFALSSFRIADADQIATIRSLGLARVRWSPEHSDQAAQEPSAPTPSPQAAEPVDDTLTRRATTARRDATRSALAAQRAATARVERQYAEASRDWRSAHDMARQNPQAAGKCFAALSQALVDKMLGARELAIRAVAETPGDRASHALNVGVISLLMGRLCGLAEADLQDLGVGALSHDIGKIDLPAALLKANESMTSSEQARYREHVALGVTLGRSMGLAPGVLLVIGQHHEYCDGSGFPKGADVNRISVAARVVSLVNHYDDLCHPTPTSRGLTPHEAMSLMFAQGQKRFDPAMLNTFVRMMGVYPPGSVVQLTDDRWAVVESVNAARPLKPTVMIYEPGVPSDETLLLDLAREPAVGIRRSLTASQLPPEVQAQLMPRTRTGWFFEALDQPADAPPAEPPAARH
jgi:putative nucleotidyltransferase with HDIG domain